MLHRLFGICLLVGLALAVAAACGHDRAQDFEVELFNGDMFRLSDQYDSNVMVINFWYPSCPPCRDEMPEFQRASERLEGEPVKFLGMFVPKGFDTEAMARQFVEDLGLTFDFATDRGEAIATAYGIGGYPTTWFIDRRGEVATTHVGAMDGEDIVDTVRELLAD